MGCMPKAGIKKLRMDLEHNFLGTEGLRTVMQNLPAGLEDRNTHVLIGIADQLFVDRSSIALTLPSQQNAHAFQSGASRAK